MNRLVTVAALAVGGYLLSKQMKKSSYEGSASSTEASIDVNVPLRTAYNQFTQFEEFPQFMSSVKEVRQLDDTHLHWRADVAGKEEEWDAEITEQIPDRRIAWRSTSGVRNAGQVSFEPLSENRTRIRMQMDYEPRSMDEKVGDALGLVKMQSKDNLRRFKQMLESRGMETGAWRGTVTH